jgi:hypothetical protein
MTTGAELLHRKLSPRVLCPTQLGRADNVASRAIKRRDSSDDVVKSNRREIDISTADIELGFG